MNGALHYTRTKKWAITEAGFSEAAAEVVARFDVGVDAEHHWSFWSDWAHGQARWHLDGCFGQRLIDEALASGDLEQLGRGLHVAQDFYAHNSLDVVPGKVTPLYWGFPLRRWHGHFCAVHGMYPTRAMIMKTKAPLPPRLREWLLARAHTDIWEQQTPENRDRLQDCTVEALRDFVDRWPDVVASEPESHT